MIKHFLIFCSLIVITILNTGCASAQYNQNYISKNIKPELKKVDKNICINETSINNIINVNKWSRGTKIDIDFEVKKTNKNVLENYFKQYFTDVNNINKNCFLIVKSEIENFDTDFENIDGMNAQFTLNVKVSKDNKKLITLSTDELYSSKVFLTFVGLSAPYKTANEAFHKGLLDVYETKFESDLLKALQKKD